MNDITTTQIIPANPVAYTPIVARRPIATRPATLGDLPFIDKLQKAHSRELGFLPTAALEGKIKLGQVLIAEEAGLNGSAAERRAGFNPPHLPGEEDGGLKPALPVPVGYLIAADRYQKRDEIGYVTQINVIPEYRRSLVAAQLLQAQFNKSAYGCRLYGCWCAQDLAANAFWEAMGFTAIAFRTGSMTKGAKKTPRVHIFWQKRIRDGDTTTPWWYPSQTGGGEIREDRLVFPILPGVHWRDVGPILLEPATSLVGATYMSPAIAESQPNVQTPAATDAQPAGDMDVAPTKKKPRTKQPIAPLTKTVVSGPVRGGFWFEEYGVEKEVPLSGKEIAAMPTKKARPAAEKIKTKIDPRLTAMARELRDQWSERADAVVQQAIGKHDVKRIASPTTMPRLLGEAA